MLWIVLLLSAALSVVGVMVYNRLVISQNQYRNAFSQIGVQLQRRHDLIPNLVAAAKGYLKHENDTFTQVTQARNQAAGVLSVARPENAEAVAQLSAAETLLTQAVRSLMVQLEAYPDLQAAANMRQLAEEITSTENRIAVARKDYIASVQEYNKLIRTFPTNIIARIVGLGGAKPSFSADSSSQKAPSVSFK